MHRTASRDSTDWAPESGAFAPGALIANLGALAFQLREVRYAPFPCLERTPLAFPCEPEVWVIADDEARFLLIDHRAQPRDEELVCRVEFWECGLRGEASLGGLFAVADAAASRGRWKAGEDA